MQSFTAVKYGKAYKHIVHEKSNLYKSGYAPVQSTPTNLKSCTCFCFFYLLFDKIWGKYQPTSTEYLILEEVGFLRRIKKNKINVLKIFFVSKIFCQLQPLTYELTITLCRH